MVQGWDKSDLVEMANLSGVRMSDVGLRLVICNAWVEVVIAKLDNIKLLKINTSSTVSTLRRLWYVLKQKG